MNNREFKKEQGERSILQSFRPHTDYSRWSIEKKIRPDFIITGPNNEKIGIEVTRLTTETAQVIHEIMREHSGKVTDPTTLKQAAIARHGRKAENYKYLMISGKPAIMPLCSNLTLQKELYATAIIKKYEKYKGIIDQFSKFIILCDARECFEMTSERDCDYLVNILKSFGFSKSFRVAIIYKCNDDGVGVVCCEEVEINAINHDER